MFTSITYPTFKDAADIHKQYIALRGQMARNGAPMSQLAALAVEFQQAWRLYHLGLLIPMPQTVDAPPIPDIEDLESVPNPANALNVPKGEKTQRLATDATGKPAEEARKKSRANSKSAADKAAADKAAKAQKSLDILAKAKAAAAKAAADKAAAAKKAKATSRDQRPHADSLQGVAFTLTAGKTKRGNDAYTITADHILPRTDFDTVNAIVTEHGGKYFPRYGWSFQDEAVAEAVCDLLNA